MDTKALRTVVDDHPEGVIVRMIDGTEYTCPHRDYIWLTPSFGTVSRSSRMATSFMLADAKTEVTRRVDALLVRDVIPMKPNGNRKGKKKA